MLVSYGAEAEEALAACDLLLQKSVRADCCKLVRIVPLPEGICKALAGYKTILFAEECVRDGGIGQQLCFALQQSGWRGTFLLHAVDNPPPAARQRPPAAQRPGVGRRRAGRQRVEHPYLKEHGMKLRLDQYLCQNGLVQSRERAKALIMSGIVFINGQKADKAGEPVPEGAVVEVRGHDIGYVSRGGLKLEKAMQVFPMHPDGKVCMDIGASTGGFTDCMLQNGAVKVYAVDVGYGQLAWSLRTDSRVVNMERTNIRNVTPDMLAEPIEFSAWMCPLSRSSIFSRWRTRSARRAPAASCLVKPQFEAGREKVGKKGVVREPATHREVLRAAIGYAEASHFSALGLDFSPIKGPEGNIEFLLFVRHGDFSPRLPEDAVDRVWRPPMPRWTKPRPATDFLFEPRSFVRVPHVPGART